MGALGKSTALFTEPVTEDLCLSAFILMRHHQASFLGE